MRISRKFSLNTKFITHGCNRSTRGIMATSSMTTPPYGKIFATKVQKWTRRDFSGSMMHSIELHDLRSFRKHLPLGVRTSRTHTHTFPVEGYIELRLGNMGDGLYLKYT